MVGGRNGNGEAVAMPTQSPLERVEGQGVSTPLWFSLATSFRTWVRSSLNDEGVLTSFAIGGLSRWNVSPLKRAEERMANSDHGLKAVAMPKQSPLKRAERDEHG